MATTLMEEETKRDSLAKVIELAEAKCAELAGVNETLEELLSQLQPLVDDCREKMKPSQHITRYVHEQFGYFTTTCQHRQHCTMCQLF